MRPFFLFLFLSLLLSKDLCAQLYFVNNAPFTVWVAIGYYVPDSEEWYAEGWYKLDDNAKTKLFDYNLSYNRYYYYYAYDLDGNVWGGGDNCSECGTFLIDPDDVFTLNSSGSKGQYEKKKFRRVDAGGSSTHTVTLNAIDQCVYGDCENGTGKYKWYDQSKTYNGSWRGGLRSGYGTCTYGRYHKSYSGCVFEGNWRNNTWDSGTLKCSSGYEATGNWRNNKLTGKVVIVHDNGNRYEGNFEDNEANGYGEMDWKDKDKTYKGYWINGSREGEGRSTYGPSHASLANCRFEGYWENNNWKKGTLVYADGSKYVGDFVDIKRHGQGKLYDANGTLLKSGEWMNDKLVFSDVSEPVITWDVPTASDMRVATAAFTIKACVQSPGDLSTVRITVNGSEQVLERGWSVEENCTYYVDSKINLRQGRNEIYISATNSKGTTKSDLRTIYYEGAGPSPSPATAARYFALLIGVDDYNDLSITDLQNPVKDTERLKSVLTASYNFRPNQVYQLKNPTKKSIIDKLEALEKELREDDYLLIFYSGHGKMQGDEGYWLPSDAQVGTSYLWFSSSELNTHIQRFKSRHVLLIADACYSGAFVMRDIEDLPTAFDSRSCEIQEGKQSRCAMTSGAKSTVPDKSVFLNYLIKELEENPFSCISAEQIYMEIKTPVISNSPNHQIPQFGDIPRTGHEGGNFIFKKN